MTDLTQQTLASLVISNHQVVPVLEKYNLDFCCGGKKTLAAVCHDKNLALSVITEELESVMAPQNNNKQMPFDEMSAEQLIGHILIHHHFYLKQSMPQIEEHLKKVAAKHGDRFPYMKEVFELFSEIRKEMTGHMEKEEKILFPFIKNVKSLPANAEGTGALVQNIRKIISVMEREHDSAGEITAKIKMLTHNYTAPESACTTFRISLAELKEFEEDLHQHVHLENNILFPGIQ